MQLLSSCPLNLDRHHRRMDSTQEARCTTEFYCHLDCYAGHLTKPYPFTEPSLGLSPSTLSLAGIAAPRPILYWITWVTTSTRTLYTYVFISCATAASDGRAPNKLDTVAKAAKDEPYHLTLIKSNVQDNMHNMYAANRPFPSLCYTVAQVIYLIREGNSSGGQEARHPSHR